MWAGFFRTSWDTRWNLQRLRHAWPKFQPHELDIRNRARFVSLIK